MTDNESPSTGGGLTPEAARVIDDYFARFQAAALAASVPGWEDAAVDLQAHVRDRLEATAGRADDAVAVLSELRPPEALAAAYAEAWLEEDAEGRPGEGGQRKLTGRLLGMPYDIRSPTSERYTSRLWNPLDRRIFPPKAWGMGWTINFGALAVRLRIVRPDDEDIPFAAVPPRIVAATLVPPLAVLVVFAVLAAVGWAHLPLAVPTHWGLTGGPDGYGSRISALAFPAVMAVVPAALAVWVHLRRRPTPERVVASAGSLFFTTFALAVLVLTLYTVGGGAGQWPLWIGLACSLVLPFVLLVLVSRLGRAAEQRHDLSAISTKGRVS
jgi:hypothetical protein